MKITSKIEMALGAIAFTSAAHGALITGTVSFTGGAILQDSIGTTTTNLSKAAGVKSWVTPSVVNGSGSFSGMAQGTSVAFTAPWVFNPSTATNPLWSVGGFTFNLASCSIAIQHDGFISIEGTGTVSGGPGFQSTQGSWFFSTQEFSSNNQTFRWSSSTVASAGRVPDGGTTLALLGSSLLGLLGLRNKLRRRSTGG